MTDQILTVTTGGSIDKEYFDARDACRIGEPIVWKRLATAKAA